MRQILAVVLFSTLLTACGAHSQEPSLGTSFWLGWQSVLRGVSEWETPTTDCQYDDCCASYNKHTQRCRRYYAHPGSLYPRM